jgi:hypothetical protein
MIEPMKALDASRCTANCLKSIARSTEHVARQMEVYLERDESWTKEESAK